MERLTGRIVAGPTPRAAGDELVEDAPAGATRLLVADVAELDPTDGALVTASGSILRYVRAVDQIPDAYDQSLLVEDDAAALPPPAEQEPDPDVPWAPGDVSHSVVLAAPLTLAMAAGDRVNAVDPLSGTPRVEYVADVVLDDEQGGDPIPTTVPIQWVDRISSLVRGGDGPTVEIEREEGASSFTLANVLGQPLVVDLSFVDIDTAPPGLGGDTAPSTAPASSPAPEVLPFPGGAIYVRFTPVADARFYRLHVATGNGATPGSATLTAKEASSPVVVRTLADGSPLPSDPSKPPGEQPMVYVAVVASNGDGLDAAPSAWVGARPGQVDPAYLQLLAGEVIAERLFGETIESVNLLAARAVLERMSTGETGSRWEMGSGIGSNTLRAFGPSDDLTSAGYLSIAEGFMQFASPRRSLQRGYVEATSGRSGDIREAAIRLLVEAEDTNPAALLRLSRREDLSLPTSSPNRVRRLISIEAELQPGLFYESVVAAARADTGWVPYAAASGWSAFGSDALQVRGTNGRVRAEGRLQPTSNRSLGANSSTAVATIPPALRPAAVSNDVPIMTSVGVAGAYILDGIVYIRPVTAITIPSTGWVSLTGLSGWLLG